MLAPEEKILLLRLARQALEEFGRSHAALVPGALSFPAAVLRNAASFVTLRHKGALRGCVGSLVAHRPLVEDVIDNSIAAGFKDDRFAPLSADEIRNITIEISVLSTPEEVRYLDHADLFRQLKAGAHGVIIEYNGRSATYLPEVAADFSSLEDFFVSLITKAGLPLAVWQNGNLKIWRYNTDRFSENDLVSLLAEQYNEK